jgi:hypothetical protein
MSSVVNAAIFFVSKLKLLHCLMDHFICSYFLDTKAAYNKFSTAYGQLHFKVVFSPFLLIRSQDFSK